MALTDTQRQQLIQAKQQGLSKEQAMARVFSARQQEPTMAETRFGDVGEDITSAVSGLGSDFMQRGRNIREGFAAGQRGEQTPTETGAQMAGNILGGAGDIAFRGAQAAITPFMKQSEEEAVAEGVGKAVEATGLPQAFEGASERTQRNIIGGLGLFEGATAGAGAAVTQPAARGITSRIGKFFGRGDEATPTTPVTTPKTPEQVFSQADNRLKQLARDESLDPRAREEAANAALTFKEKYIGLTPDVKSRLGQMGPQKLQEYLDAAHIRNIDDSAPTPYEIGAQNVNTALDNLNAKLNETGSEIGQARQKLATIKAPNASVKRVEDTFNNELNKLNLTVRNGQIVQKPGTVSKTDAASDVRVLQSLYNEMQVFKQSPTLKNAIDLRMAFDGKIKFGKAARDVSNSVDPVSRAVRASLAKESASVVGKTNAAELQRYSDFMEAYGDLKSYTDRAAGGEYLLRLVLSGRGGEARKLIDTVKEYTGNDLMNDATAMKVATETLGNENTKNLFRQEVTRAGYDAAAVLSGGPIGTLQVVGSKLLDYGINPEDVLKAAAAGTGGYVLYTYVEPEGLVGPAGIAVLSAMPSGARKQALKQAQDIASASGKTLKVSDDVRDGVQMALKDVDMNQMQSPGGRAGGSTIELDDIDELERLQAGMETPDGLTDTDFIEAQALLDKYNIPYEGKAKAATPETTDLVEEARKYDSAEEFIKSLPTGNELDVNTIATKSGEPVLLRSYHGTNQDFETFDLSRAELGRGGSYSGEGFYFTPSDIGAGTFGNVKEVVLDLKNPYVTYLPEGNIDKDLTDVAERAKKNGYDSLVVRIKDTNSDTGAVESDFINEIVVFDDSRIVTKSQIDR